MPVILLKQGTTKDRDTQLIHIEGNFQGFGLSVYDIQRILQPFGRIINELKITFRDQELSEDRRPVTYSTEEGVHVFKYNVDPIDSLRIGVGLMVFERLLTEQEKAMWRGHFPIDPENRFSASFYLFSIGSTQEDLTQEEGVFMKEIFKRLEIDLPK